MNLLIQTTNNIRLHGKSLINCLTLTHHRNMIDCHCHIIAKEFDEV